MLYDRVFEVFLVLLVIVALTIVKLLCSPPDRKR
jgi:hypothetical protein